MPNTIAVAGVRAQTIKIVTGKKAKSTTKLLLQFSGGLNAGAVQNLGIYYPGTEEAHTNPTRQRGECLRALAGASG